MLTSYQPVGFLRKEGKRHDEREKISEDEALFIFDDGSGLSLQDACRNVFISGQTGVGKTRTVVNPMIKNLIKNGLGGIIFDIKGSLKKDVYAIAKKIGREKDVVEFGSSDGANATNLLNGLKMHEIGQLFEEMVKDDGVDKDNNMHWCLKGAVYATEICEMMRILSEIDEDCHFSRQFRPNLSFLYGVVNNKYLQLGFYKFFEPLAETIQGLLSFELARCWRRISRYALLSFMVLGLLPDPIFRYPSSVRSVFLRPMISFTVRPA